MRDTPQKRARSARRLRYSRKAWRVCSQALDEIEAHVAENARLRGQLDDERALVRALRDHLAHAEAEEKSIGGFSFDPRVHCLRCSKPKAGA